MSLSTFSKRLLHSLNLAHFETFAVRLLVQNLQQQQKIDLTAQNSGCAAKPNKYVNICRRRKMICRMWSVLCATCSFYPLKNVDVSTLEWISMLPSESFILLCVWTNAKNKNKNSNNNNKKKRNVQFYSLVECKTKTCRKRIHLRRILWIRIYECPFGGQYTDINGLILTIISHCGLLEAHTRDWDVYKYMS